MADTNITPATASLTLTGWRLFVTNPVARLATMVRLAMRRIQSA